MTVNLIIWHHHHHAVDQGHRLERVGARGEHQRLAETLSGTHQAQHLFAPAAAAQRELEQPVADGVEPLLDVASAADDVAATHVLHARMARQFGDMCRLRLPQQRQVAQDAADQRLAVR